MSRTLIILRMMKSLLAMVGLFSSLSAFAAPVWQLSAHYQIELSIRDTNPNGNYAVTFVVVDQESKTKSVKKQAGGDVWTGVIYPDDFATDLKPGRYRWHGCVDGVKAVGGQFSYTVKGDSESLTSSTKWPKRNSPC